MVCRMVIQGERVWGEEEGGFFPKLPPTMLCSSSTIIFVCRVTLLKHGGLMNFVCLKEAPYGSLHH